MVIGQSPDTIIESSPIAVWKSHGQTLFFEKIDCWAPVAKRKSPRSRSIQTFHMANQNYFGDEPMATV